MGFVMPKGSSIIANIWYVAYPRRFHSEFTFSRAAMRDPTIYPEPDKFDPDRFLSPNNQMDSRKLAFGFGQRVCPVCPFSTTLEIHSDCFV